ncbi:hypothetical protein MASR2M78_29270 [Treponema sp.]
MEINDQYKKRLFRGYLAAAVLPAAVFFILGLVSVLISYAYAVKEANLISTASLRHARDLLESIIAETDSVVLGMSTDPEFSVAAHRSLGGGIETYDDLQSRNIFFTTLNMAVNTRAFLRSMYVYVGGSAESLAISSVGVIPRSSFSDSAWIDEWAGDRNQIGALIKTRDIHPLMDFPLRYTVISVYRNMLYAGSFQYNGMIVANINIEYMEKLLEEDANRAGGLIQLRTLDGTVVLETGELTDRNPVYNEMELTKYPFKLVSASSREVYYRLPRTLAFTSSAIFFIALSMGFLSAYMMSRRNFKSIAAVVDIIRAAENNQALPQVQLPPGDGVHYLVYSILKTFVESRFLRVRLNEKELKQKALELLALQSQMNPHFLFNVLTTISFKSMQYTGGPNDATRMVDHLSKILEYSLADPSVQQSLANEIEYAKRYVAIQEYRYRGAFTIAWDIDEGVLGCPCQRMLIQPLVENSIDHGLRGLDRAVNILVECRKREDWLCIRVADDGIGMSKAKAAELEEKIRSENVENDCIGLVNTCRRLLLRYGEDARYEIISGKGEGTSILLEYRP